MTETGTGVPPHWRHASIGELGEVRGGVTKNASKIVQGAITLPYLRVANVYANELRLDDVAEMAVSSMDSVRARLAPGDLLVVEGNGSLDQIGRVALWTGRISPCLHQNHLIRVRFAIPELSAFVLYWLLSPKGRERVTQAASSTSGLHTLSLSKVEGLLVPVAPLPEQRQIVGAIESYLTRLDDAMATLERVRRNLKRYRASVLKAAVEGRLVPTEAELARAEGRTYEPASVLLERILAERHRRWAEAGKAGKYDASAAPNTADLPELPEGWCWATVGDLVTRLDAGKNFKCIERPPERGEVGVVKISAVTWGTFKEGESKTCPRLDLANEAHVIRAGDFLISRANTIELVGACVIVPAVQRRLMLSDKVLRLQILGGLDAWLLWVLRSPHGRCEIQFLATGNQESMRNISQERILRIRVPLPPQAECHRVVAELERQMSVFEHDAVAVRQAEGRCQRLRQAILKWAFEGKLADQDPGDEPAAALLERVRRKVSASREIACDTRKRRQRRIGKRRFQGVD